MRGHLAGGVAETTKGALRELGALLRNPMVLLSYTTGALLMMATFLVMPTLAPYAQNNLNYPREHFGRLYLYGGVATFITVRLAGPMVDRLGAYRNGVLGAALYCTVIYCGLCLVPPPISVATIYVASMVGMAIRSVSFTTLTSKVPLPAERARFMSMSSAVQHLASAIAASLSARLLQELPDKRLDGMGRVAAVAIAATVVYLPLFWLIEKRRTSSTSVAVNPSINPAAKPTSPTG